MISVKRKKRLRYLLFWESEGELINNHRLKRWLLQTVDKLGVGCYAPHHFSVKTSFLFIFFKINKNLAVFQPRFSRIFASFFRFMHAKVSPAFISIRAFPTYCVYRNPCCSFAVPNILSMVFFLTDRSVCFLSCAECLLPLPYILPIHDV